MNALVICVTALIVAQFPLAVWIGRRLHRNQPPPGGDQ